MSTEPDSSGFLRSPGRRLTLVSAALLFVVILLVRLLAGGNTGTLILLYTLPVAALAVGFALDRARRVTNESERFWQLSTDLFATADASGRFRRLNPAWERILGWSAEELRSRPFVDFVHPDDCERTERETAAASLGQTHNFENRYLHKDGTYRNLLWSSRAEPDGLIYAVARDITDRVEAERELRLAKEDAERANQAKGEFLSRVSHELRTPLNAVIGFGQLLELEDLEPAQRESVGQILRGGRQLLTLVNELLDISEIESGTLAISPQTVQVSSVLAEALTMTRPLADRARVRIDAEAHQLAGLYVAADHGRLRQVLNCLLSNAVKYNRAGGTVTVDCRPLADDRLQFSVADDGCGISPEQLGELFTPFDRLGAEHGPVEGSGLGLALSRRLVEAMGGTIEAESELGKGSVFRVELAAAQAPRESAPQQPPLAPELPPRTARPPARTVLHIADSPFSLKLVERSLKPIDRVAVVSALRGRLGPELVARHRPDLVLLDLHEPDAEGLALLRRLAADPDTGSIPVTVISAATDEAGVERLLAAGAGGVLGKPIDVSRLLDLVADLSVDVAERVPEPG